MPVEFVVEIDDPVRAAAAQRAIDTVVATQSYSTGYVDESLFGLLSTSYPALSQEIEENGVTTVVVKDHVAVGGNSLTTPGGVGYLESDATRSTAVITLNFDNKFPKQLNGFTPVGRSNSLEEILFHELTHIAKGDLDSGLEGNLVNENIIMNYVNKTFRDELGLQLRQDYQVPQGTTRPGFENLSDQDDVNLDLGDEPNVRQAGNATVTPDGTGVDIDGIQEISFSKTLGERLEVTLESFGDLLGFEPEGPAEEPANVNDSSQGSGDDNSDSTGNNETSSGDTENAGTDNGGNESTGANGDNNGDDAGNNGTGGGHTENAGTDTSSGDSTGNSGTEGDGTENTGTDNGGTDTSAGADGTNVTAPNDQGVNSEGSYTETDVDLGSGVHGDGDVNDNTEQSDPLDPFGGPGDDVTDVDFSEDSFDALDPEEDEGAPAYFGMPVGIDLDGDGIEFTFGQDQYYDWNRDGYLERTSWISGDDAFLVIDLNANGTRGAGDGRIDLAEEIAFQGWLDSARTDLEGLSYFDTSTDGEIDGVAAINASDEAWTELRVWQDSNENAVVDEGELQSLEHHGITAINLSYDDGTDFSDVTNDISIFDSTVHGFASLDTTEGTKAAGVADLTLAATLTDRLASAPDYVRFEGTLENDVLVGRNGNDIIKANTGDDNVNGDDGNDILFGGFGDDILVGGNGDDVVFGGEGTDTALYFENRGGGLQVSQDLTKFVWEITTAAFGTDVIIDTERVQFDDGTFLINRTEDPSTLAYLYLMYDTAFDRRADEEGFEHYLTQMTDFGMTEEEVYESFRASLEGEAAFSPAVKTYSDGDFVEFLFQSALDRPTDQPSLDDYTARLVAGDARYQITHDISSSQEHSSLLSDDFGENWAWVSTSSYWQTLADAIKAGLSSAALGDQTGTAGDDTYYHVIGNGSYSISDRSSFGGARDKLVLLDYERDHVSFSQNSVEDLIITTNAGEVITIIDQFGSNLYGMEYIEFVGGIVLNTQNIRDKVVSDMKSSGNVLGSRWGETYVHEQDDGSYTINDRGSFSGEVDRLDLQEINVGDVIFSQSGENLLLTFASGEVITVIEQFSNSNLYGMEEIKFDDGTVLDTQAIDAKVLSDEAAIASLDLIINGDFEDISAGTGENSVPTGWTKTGDAGGVFFAQPSWNYGEDHAYGLGRWSSAQGQTLDQSVSTTVGESYTLTFDSGATWRSSAVTLDVMADDLLLISLTDAELGRTQIERSISFVATDSTTDISFVLNGTGSEFVNLDNISVIPDYGYFDL